MSFRLQLPEIERLETLIERLRNGDKTDFTRQSAVAVIRKLSPTQIVDTVLSAPERALSAAYNLLPGVTIVIDGKNGFLGIGAETSVDLVYRNRTYRTVLKSRDHALAVWCAVVPALKDEAIEDAQALEEAAPIAPVAKKPAKPRAPKKEPALTTEKAEPAEAPAKRTRKAAQRKKPSTVAESDGDVTVTGNDGLIGASDGDKQNVKQVVKEGKKSKAPAERSSAGSLRPVGFKPQASGRDTSTTSGSTAPRLSAKDLSRR